MMRAFQMIFAPEGAWVKIAEKNRNMLFTLFFSTLPLVVVCLAIEGYGLEKLGESYGEFGKINVVRSAIINYEFTHLALDVAFLLGGAWFLMSVAHSFHANVTISQSFNTLAYGASPIFLMHALDGIPHLHTWLCWGIGAGLAVRALYHGVAINLKPEQTKGMGLYIVSIFIVSFLSGLAHFLAITILHNKALV
jgi:hypothetical protein